MQKLKWGLIGCGDIARKRVAPALVELADCELVAVARARAELAKSFAKDFGVAKWYENWEDLLDDPQIQAVYIATPVYLHAEQAILAAKKGKHVLCEKPMALNTVEGRRIIKNCSQANIYLGIAYYRHFYPVIGRIKQIIASGEIGQVVIAQINAFEWFDRFPGQDRFWLLEPDKAGGGPMKDFGCHRIEVLLNILGPVKGVVSRLSLLHFMRQVEDTAFVCLEFESKAQGLITVTHAAFETQDSLNIYASKGSIHISVLNKGKMEVLTKEGRRIENFTPHTNVHLPLIADFTKAVLNNEQPSVGGEIGLDVLKIEDRIYQEKI